MGSEHFGTIDEGMVQTLPMTASRIGNLIGEFALAADIVVGDPADEDAASYRGDAGDRKETSNAAAVGKSARRAAAAR